MSISRHTVRNQPRYLVARAVRMRTYFERHPDLAESKLWQRLKGDQLGVRVRQQAPVSHPEKDMIVDFLIMKSDLVIEIGDRDDDRERRLRERGLITLWIPEEVVLNDLDFAVDMIKNRLFVLS